MTHTDATSGRDLRDLRDEHRLTQDQIATSMRTTQQYVSTIEGKATVRHKTAERYRSAVYAYAIDAKKAS